MAEPTLTDRVTILEQNVEDLNSLPPRVAGMDEMQVGSSAIRQEMALMRDDLRTEFHDELHGIRGALDGLRDELHRTRDVLRAEIREGDEETRRYMRVLHEEVIARIATLGAARG